MYNETHPLGVSTPITKHSQRVLLECIEMQNDKGGDYQAKGSGIRQADHYPRGVNTLLDMLWQKNLRARSVAYKMHEDESVNYESFEDSIKDLINYASFTLSYFRGEMDGQNKDRDMFNRSTNKNNEPD